VERFDEIQILPGGILRTEQEKIYEASRFGRVFLWALKSKGVGMTIFILLII
jgi:hypothetical protein